MNALRINFYQKSKYFSDYYNYYKSKIILIKIFRSIGSYRMLLEFLLNENEVKIDIDDFLSDSKAKFLTKVIFLDFINLIKFV